MDWIVVGGDRRMQHLAVRLGAKQVGGTGAGVPGVVTAAEEALSDADGVVLNSPVKGEISLERVAELASRGAFYVFAGPDAAPQTFSDRHVADLSQDEWFLTRNAELTAEGAIVAATGATERAICDWECLVIGWGRIGRALTERLVALGARVTVASRAERGRMQAISRGASVADTARLAGALPGKTVVFSTPPSAVLDSGAMAMADEGTLLIDLASPPYGIDLDAAQFRGLRAWREPALPGRYCPVSAAMVLEQAIRRACGGEDLR